MVRFRVVLIEAIDPPAPRMSTWSKVRAKVKEFYDGYKLFRVQSAQARWALLARVRILPSI